MIEACRLDMGLRHSLGFSKQMPAMVPGVMLRVMQIPFGALQGGRDLWRATRLGGELARLMHMPEGFGDAGVAAAG